MRLRHIEIFHAVYLSGSVSGAARSLNVSQPTVSKILKHAEDQLGFLLFQREKGRLFPTEKADLLYQQVLPLYEQLNELKIYTAALATTKTGRLRIAMTPAFGLEIGPMILAQFCKNNPDVTVEVETQHSVEIKKLLLNNSIDFGLAYEASASAGLSISTVGYSRFVCVSPTRLDIKSPSLKITELKDYPVIRLNPKSPLGLLLDLTLEKQSENTLSGPIIAETYHLAKRLAAQGVGLAIIDKITAKSGNSDKLNIHDLPDLDPIKINLIMRSGEHLTQYKRDFVHLVEKTISQ